MLTPMRASSSGLLQTRICNAVAVDNSQSTSRSAAHFGLNQLCVQQLSSGQTRVELRRNAERPVA